MLRVGLTGELGSGKSTVAAMLAKHGAIILSSDEIARAMMQPGHAVFAQIVEQFGPAVLNPDGTLDRRALARLAFDPASPRIERLNAIIHPAVIAAQADRIAEICRTAPHAIVVIESALIFSTRHAPGRGWLERFDCIVVVTAPDEQKIERFVRRVQRAEEDAGFVREDAARRLAAQRSAVPDEVSYYTIANDRSLADLQKQVDELWRHLVEREATADFEGASTASSIRFGNLKSGNKET
jgi:dephospho-CoA kinase